MEDKFNNMKEVVVKMHTDNGLLDEVGQRGFYPSEMHRDMELARVDQELADWVRSFAGGDHMPFAGSGVAHYDRKFIKRDLPLLDRRLTYYSLDIGSARRILDLADVKWPQVHFSKSHRALDDARQHIQETVAFLNWANAARWSIGEPSDDKYAR
jgi:oligoribonuclease (3'-5' exoribonuclease)